MILSGFDKRKWVLKCPSGEYLLPDGNSTPDLEADGLTYFDTKKLAVDNKTSREEAKDCVVQEIYYDTTQGVPHVVSSVSIVSWKEVPQSE